MIDLLRRAAATTPDRTAVVTDMVALTYADLLSRAETLGEVLSGLVSDSRPVEGDRDRDTGADNSADHRGGGASGRGLRFAVASVDADVVVPALAAAAAIGAEACVFPPDGPEVVDRLLDRFGQSHVVRTEVREAETPVHSHGTRWAGVTAVASAAEATQQTGSTERPHLVLTTGTTGEPRGVRHDWTRLLRSTERVPFGAAPNATRADVDSDEDSARWLLAYGLHQFAGLQVLLHVFAAGETLIAPTPRRPREGLAAMRRHGVTHASATPTYWRFLMAELRSDGGPTPRLHQITLGGEAAPGPVLTQLREQFPQARLSHVYAASEFGATNSTKDGLPGLPAAVLERGDDADVQMKVVDGELWVRSKVGMLGYHGEEPVAPDAWRPTGDLVEQVDGRLLFRGRVSEIINVGGVKVHPLPIEEAVAAVPGVRVSRVFGRPNAMTGAIVAVEVVSEPGADVGELKRAVRDACAELPAAARPRSVKVVDEIHTAGGKIVRRNP